MRSVKLLVALALGMMAFVRPPAVVSSSLPPAGGAGASLLFVENVGQFDPEARFQVLGSGAMLWLAEDALWLTLPAPSEEGVPSSTQAVHLRITFPGSNPHPRLEPFDRQEAVLNYYRGNDPAQWHTQVPVWGGVRYVDLYPGVDLVVGDGLALASRDALALPWRFEVRPEADLSAVRMRVEGAEAVQLSEGALDLETAVGPWTLPLPACEAALQTTVIPVEAQVFEIAAPFAPPMAAPPLLLPQRASSASSLVLAYVTSMDGSFTERGQDIAVDDAGDIYVAGYTNSPDFPTTPGVVGSSYHGGDYDAFVFKLRGADGALLFATFLGGIGDDWGHDLGYGVAVDEEHNVYVTGCTDSPRFPVTAGAYDTTFNGQDDIFLVKLNPTATRLLYATYLGGSLKECALDVEADASGHAYVTGWTESEDFPVVAASTGFDTFQGGETDVFVAKLNAEGSALDYALFVGGSETDVGMALAVSESGYAYVTGMTESSDFPRRFASDYTLSGTGDAFLIRVRPSGGSLFSGTYLGGSMSEVGWDVAVDDEGYAYVVGGTDSTDFPTTPGSFGPSHNGGAQDAFVAKLGLGSVIYAGYLGYDGDERGYGIAVDSTGSAYVVGAIGNDVLTIIAPDGTSVLERFTDLALRDGNKVAVDAWGGSYVLGIEPPWVARLAQPALISGQVTDGKGEPLAGIQLAAGGGVFTATTGVDGRYTLSVTAGSNIVAPLSPGYFWSPESRTVTVPPEATGQDFVGRGIVKAVTPEGMRPVEYGESLTYTVRLIAPEDRSVLLYDPLPTYTAFISGSLSGPAGVAYDSQAHAISGSLVLTAGVPDTVTFGVRVAVTGTSGFAPTIANRACLRPVGSDLTACEWSDETINYTYLQRVYLPVVLRSASATRSSAVRARSLPRATEVEQGLSDAPGYNVQLVGHIGGSVRAVFVQGDRTYIGEGPKLTILDTSVLTSPRALGRSALWDDYVRDIKVVGDYAYLAVGTEGLRVVNISEPAAPREVGAVEFGLDSEAIGVWVSGSYAYVSSERGFWVVDISNPAAPALRSYYDYSVSRLGGLAVRGNYLYLADYYGLQVIDVSDPEDPVKVTTLVQAGFGGDTSVTIIGDYAYWYNDAENRLFVFDLSTPGAPRFVRKYSISSPVGSFQYAAAEGNTLYLMGSVDDGLLTALDVADPMQPVRLGSYRIPETASDVAVSGGLAYIAAGRAGLQVVDVSRMLVERGFYYPSGQAEKVAAGEQYVYLLPHGFDAELYVLDVSDPASPQVRSVYLPDEWKYVENMAFADGTLYLLGGGEQWDDYNLSVVDPSNPDALQTVGTLLLGDHRPTAIAVAGNYAYTVGETDNRLRVFDISDPSSPTEVGNYYRAVGCDLAVAGHYVYVAATASPYGLKVFDVLTPTAPVKVGEWYSSYPHAVAVSGTYAYLADDSGVRVLDVSEPAHPTLVGSYDYVADDLTVVGDLLYMTGDDGLRVVDISMPGQPQDVVSYFTVEEAYGVAVQGDSAYFASGWNGLRILDVSSLAQKARRGAYDGLPVDARDVAVVGGYAYVADGTGGLKVVNVFTPTAPMEAGRLETEGAALDVKVKGHYAYLSTAGGMVVADVSDANLPRQTGRLVKEGVMMPAVDVLSDTAYLAAGWNGLYLADVTTPTTPTELAYTYLDSQVNDITVITGSASTYAYLSSSGGSDHQGLCVLDVTDPLSLTTIGSLSAWNAYEAQLSGSHAYVAARWSGLRIVDISDPAHLTETGGYAKRESPHSVVVDGRYAYILEDSGFRVVDVADPRHPVEVGEYRIDGASWYIGGQLILDGDTLYLAALQNGLRVVDVSDPRHPREVGRYQPSDLSIEGVAVSGHYAVVTAEWPPELQVVDVSDPTDIRLTGVYTGSTFGRPLAALGTLIYLQGESGERELVIVDIADPASPHLAGYYDAYNVFNLPTDIAIDGHYAYLSLGSYGLHVLDISSPSQPSLLTRVRRGTYDLAIVGDTLYATGSRLSYGYWADGLVVFDISNPVQPTAVGFHETVNAGYGLDAAGSYAYVADYEMGLLVMGVSNPAEPAEVGLYRIPSGAVSVEVGAYLYLLEEEGTLRVISVADPTSPREVGHYRLPALGEVIGEPLGGLALDGGYLYVADGAAGLYILRYAGEVEYTHSIYLPLVMRH